MPLERDHVLLLGPRPREFDGKRTRNVELQPCGCWAGEVWRDEYRYDQQKLEFVVVGKAWCQDTQQCKVHAAAVIVLQLQAGKLLANQGRSRAMGTVTKGADGQVEIHMGEKLDGNAFLARLGDGAKKLYADADRILAEADALNHELKALTHGASRLPRREISPKDKLHWALPAPEKTGKHDE